MQHNLSIYSLLALNIAIYITVGDRIFLFI